MPQQVSIKHHFLFSVKGRQKVQSLSIEDWLVVEEMEAADVFSMAGKTKKYNHCHQWNVGQIYSKDEETSAGMAVQTNSNCGAHTQRV